MPELTNEQKRVKIAEACPSVFGIRKESRDVYLLSTLEEVDPLEDLNAIAQAEATLRQCQFEYVDYPRALFEIVTGRKWDGDMGYFFYDYATATATQRADAFLKVKGIL